MPSAASAWYMISLVSFANQVGLERGGDAHQAPFEVERPATKPSSQSARLVAAAGSLACDPY
jgi:hypothetical protein